MYYAFNSCIRKMRSISKLCLLIWWPEMLTELEISNYGTAHLRQQAKNIKSMWKLVREEGAVQELGEFSKT